LFRKAFFVRPPLGPCEHLLAHGEATGSWIG
jgi:hypothetical protein